MLRNAGRGVLLLLLLASCSTRGDQGSLAELASSNQGRLNSLSLGMTREQVLTHMGAGTAATRDGIVNNPWTVEAFTNGRGVQYEVLYYVTRKNPPFTPVRKSLTTPIVLQDGRVIGWGTEALNRIGTGTPAQ
ncbi:MAG: DUF3192 domain-containing protein [Candidatus Binatia bacterium]